MDLDIIRPAILLCLVMPVVQILTSLFCGITTNRIVSVLTLLVPMITYVVGLKEVEESDNLLGFLEMNTTPQILYSLGAIVIIGLWFACKQAPNAEKGA